MIINSLTGALAIRFLHERPKCFKEECTDEATSLILFPHDALDFEAVMLSDSGAPIIAPIFSSLAASHYFSLRGIPRSAVSMYCCGSRVDIPIISEKDTKSAEYPVKCKQIYSKTVVFSGGMEHVLYTEGGKCRTRIIEAPSEIDFSAELLSRLRVVDGLPDTVRSIAYRRVGGSWRMASTDATLTLDSVMPLAGLLMHRGVRGMIEIICRGVTFPIRIPERLSGEVLISASALFPTCS